jgi:hypothetical protein
MLKIVVIGHLSDKRLECVENSQLKGNEWLGNSYFMVYPAKYMNKTAISENYRFGICFAFKN